MNEGFNYVDITDHGCEGWINLFYGDACIDLVSDVALANEIRKGCKARVKQKPTTKPTKKKRNEPRT
jgi:hypothetical protein